MSTRAVGWGLDQHAGLDPTTKLVLLALCDSAHRDDDCAWLSRRTLATVALRRSPRTADRCLAILAEAGYIARADPAVLSDDRRASYLALAEHLRPQIWKVFVGDDITNPVQPAALGGVQSTARDPVQSPRAVPRAVATAPKPKENQLMNLGVDGSDDDSGAAPVEDFDTGAAALRRIREARTT